MRRASRYDLRREDQIISEVTITKSANEGTGHHSGRARVRRVLDGRRGTPGRCDPHQRSVEPPTRPAMRPESPGDRARRRPRRGGSMRRGRSSHRRGVHARAPRRPRPVPRAGAASRAMGEPPADARRRREVLRRVPRHRRRRDATKTSRTRRSAPEAAASELSSTTR